MTNRDAILKRIRTALAFDAPLEPPPVPEVWPVSSPTTDAMAQRFTDEIRAVSGQLVRCDSLEEARRELAALLDLDQCTKVGMSDRPLCRELATAVGDRAVWPDPAATPKTMADLSAGLLEAEYLLADTGSCVIAGDTPWQRVLCYLPPTCIILARADRLVEHLPAAWQGIARRVGEPSVRGEFVFITGPSRTADIEKILILGVHGPKRVVVLLIG